MFKEVFQLALANADPVSWPTFDGMLLDRNDFLSSSETAACLRKAYFAKNQTKYPMKVGGGFSENGFTQRGHAIEAWLVHVMQPLKKLGFTLEYMGKDQRSFYDAELGISGTPDGILTFPDGKKFLLEVKSIDPRANKNNLPKKNHIYQTQQNMFLVQKCLNIKLDGGILFYIDASNVYDIKEYPMNYDEQLVTESIERAAILWDAESPDNVEPEGIYTGDCDYCQFTHHCSQTVDMENKLKQLKEKPSPFLGGETLSLNDEERIAVEQWIAAREGLKQYEDEKDQVDGTVRQLVIKYNGYVQVDGTGLIGKTLPGRETIDKKLMEADGLDISKYTKQGAPYVVINVKEDQPI